MLAATAAILPFAIATSRTALMLLRASMTCPPFSRRSYLCCADRPTIEPTIRTTAAACSLSLIAQPISLIATKSRKHETILYKKIKFVFSCFRGGRLGPPIVVPLRRPLRRQVLAHVERSRHRVRRDGAVEPEAEGVAVPLGVRAVHLHAAAVDGAGEIARHEIALVRALEPIARLLQVERVAGGIRRVFDPHIPLPGQIRGRRRCSRGRLLLRRIRQDGMEPLGDYLFLGSRHHVRRDRDAG